MQENCAICKTKMAVNELLLTHLEGFKDKQPICFECLMTVIFNTIEVN